jgi:hypothetical protein
MRTLIFLLALVLTTQWIRAQPAPVKVKEGLVQGTSENGRKMEWCSVGR